VRTEKGCSNSSIAVFCYYLELGEKVRDNFGCKCSKDKKYWDFSCIDRNTRVAPLQANFSAIVSTWDEVTGQSIFKDLCRELVSRRYGYKKVKDRLYFDRDFIDLANNQSFEIQKQSRDKADIYTHITTKTLGKNKSQLIKKRGGDY